MAESAALIQSNTVCLSCWRLQSCEQLRTPRPLPQIFFFVRWAVYNYFKASQFIFLSCFLLRFAVIFYPSLSLWSARGPARSYCLSEWCGSRLGKRSHWRLGCCVFVQASAKTLCLCLTVRNHTLKRCTRWAAEWTPPICLHTDQWRFSLVQRSHFSVIVEMGRLLLLGVCLWWVARNWINMYLFCWCKDIGPISG